MTVDNLKSYVFWTLVGASYLAAFLLGVGWGQ
jgi:hypothetical protein